MTVQMIFTINLHKSYVAELGFELRPAVRIAIDCAMDLLELKFYSPVNTVMACQVSALTYSLFSWALAGLILYAV